MNLELNNKTAVIAASSHGLGKATAARLAREGANVVICARGKEALMKTAEEIQRGHGPACGVGPGGPYQSR